MKKLRRMKYCIKRPYHKKFHVEIESMSNENISQHYIKEQLVIQTLGRYSMYREEKTLHVSLTASQYHKNIKQKCHFFNH